jgi:hypothetical protein
MSIVPDRALLYGEEIARCKEDFLYFCENYLKILDRNSKLVSFKLKPAQLALLKSLEGNPWQVVLKARQMGSSTLVAAYFFWKTLFTPNESIKTSTTTCRSSYSLVQLLLLQMKLFSFMAEQFV